MKIEVINEDSVNNYKNYLIQEEKSEATIKKYLCDIKTFLYFVKQAEITKELVMDYKKELQKKYQTSSANSMIIALNGFFEFLGLSQFKVKVMKVQKRVFAKDEEELSEAEYQRLLEAAHRNKNERLMMLLQVIGTTGIRVSEHKFITVESLTKGYVTIVNKGKVRDIPYPKELRKNLLRYCQKYQIKEGSIFVTKTGKPLDRSNIWKMMKSLCESAEVDAKKVYPHNIRHLFAVSFYSIEKDIVRLADILGHSSIDTTKIYVRTSGMECERIFNQLNLIKMNI